MQIPRTNRKVTSSLKRLIARAISLRANDSKTGPLSGAIETAEEWVKIRQQGQIVRVKSAETLIVPENRSRKQAAPPHLCVQENIQFSRLYAARLPNARILDGEGALILDNRLALDMSPHYEPGRLGHYALIRRRLPPPEFVDTSALILTGIDSRNHYHWLLDVLPRYEVAQRSGLRWDHVIGPAVTPVQRACYARLGIDETMLLAPPSERQFSVREAIVSSFPSLRFSPSPLAVQFARKLFRDCMQETPASPRYIYVSRRKCGQRRVDNENEVERGLTKLGYETVVLENLDFEDQIRLFFNAESIIAPHGAGLANCAFCRPGTSLIEIFGTTYTPGFFRRLAAICRMNYRCLVENNAKGGNEDTINLKQDLHVNVSQLQKLVTG